MPGESDHDKIDVSNPRRPFRSGTHRSVIDEAKGVIMQTMHCGPEAAFAALVAQSQSENRKLWEVATELAGAQDHGATSS